MHSDPMSDDDLLHDSYVDAIGDIDGDGLDDIALGARGTIYPFYECGGVYIAYASTIMSAIDFTPDIHIYGDEPAIRLAMSIQLET